MDDVKISLLNDATSSIGFKATGIQGGENKNIDLSILSRMKGVATLTTAAAQTINTAVNHNALCEVELTDDATFTLENLTAPCNGIIDVAALTTQRAFTILAQDGSATSIDVEYRDGAYPVSEDGKKLSISWEYNGSWVNVNYSNYES